MAVRKASRPALLLQFYNWIEKNEDEQKQKIKARKKVKLKDTCFPSTPTIDLHFSANITFTL